MTSWLGVIAAIQFNVFVCNLILVVLSCDLFCNGLGKDTHYPMMWVLYNYASMEFLPSLGCGICFYLTVYIDGVDVRVSSIDFKMSIF